MMLNRTDQAFADALLEDDPVALYERAPCGYLSTTPDGVIVRANRTFADWIGHPPDELVGRPLVSLLTPGSRIFYETHYAPMVRLQGFAREVAVDVIRSDDSRLPVLLNARLVTDEQHEPRVVRVAVFDATERRAYERELLRATGEAKDARARAEEAERQSQLLVDTLQRTLVPGTMPYVEGLELHGGYRPAGTGDQVGGDFYDVFPTGPDECWLLLGDVSGKGVGAAVVTSLVRHAARVLVEALGDPTEVLTRLNDLVLRDETERYCTAIVARMGRRTDGTWDVWCASGGHPSGLLRKATGEVSSVLPGGQVVGLIPDASFASVPLTLHPGDTLLLYTDGITEGRRGNDFFGDQRLVDAVRSASTGSGAVVDMVVQASLDFQAGLTSDDIACLAVTIGD